MTEREYRLRLYDRLFGFVLVLILTGLAAMFGFGVVEEKTSYGLHEILLILGMVAGAWSSWTFRSSDKSNNGHLSERPKKGE